MNAFKKQLRLPSSFSGMKKAVSTSNLTDKHCAESDSSPHNLTLDRGTIKSKGLANHTQDIVELLSTLYGAISKNSNENFTFDELPTSLTTEWLSAKYIAEGDTRIQKKNSAIVELLSTELNYLNQMQFLLDVSSKVFSVAQPKYFPNVTNEDIFLNIGDIYEVNYHFWKKYLHPSYEDAKENDHFLSCESWKDGFNQISSIFLPYQSYFSKMTKCQKFIQSLDRDKYFSQFLQWFSRTDQSNRESLSDFIAKPFQRLTKYKLLLITISNYSDDQNERNNLTEMINSVNLFLKQVEWKLSMAHISLRMDPIEYVEAPTEDLMELCSQYRQISLTTPIHTNDGEVIRQMIKEGTFKMKEAQMKAVDVSLILFTDLLLVCQKIKNFEIDRIKVIKPIIPLNKLDIRRPLSGSLVLIVVDDFGCLTAMYLLTSDHSSIDEWMEVIENTQYSIKNAVTSRHTAEHKWVPTLTVNLISPSPLPGQSPTQQGVAIPMPSMSPRLESFHQSHLYESGSFSRSNFLSSPVTRRRLGSSSPLKNRTESLPNNHRTPRDTMSINRSMSQHYSKSQLSILEDDGDDDQAFLDDSDRNLDSSLSSIDVLLENMDGTLTSNHENGDSELASNGAIKYKLSVKKNDKLNEMRAYGSMMNLSMNS